MNDKGKQSAAVQSAAIQSAAIIVDMRTIRCDHCKVAIHDDLATDCSVCGAHFDSIVSNHVGLAARLEKLRAEAGVRSCAAR